jgi:hypothetical protein
MSDKPFTVNDRRLFTADGQLRQEPGTDGPTPSPQPPAGKRPSPPSAAPEVSFSQFLLSLAAEASLLLSGQALPEEVPTAEALAGARRAISVLEMLQDKTAGRRTPEEDEILESVLYQLRMAYVERAKVSGA